MKKHVFFYKKKSAGTFRIPSTLNPPPTTGRVFDTQAAEAQWKAPLRPLRVIQLADGDYVLHACADDA
jgi:hypothetical protein